MLSYGSAWLAFTALGLGLLFRWRNRSLSLPVLSCVALTAVWAAVIAVGSRLEYPPIKLIQIAEATRNLAWNFLLYNMYSEVLRGSGHFFASRRWLPWFLAGVCLLGVHIFTATWLIERFGLPSSVMTTLTYIMWLGFALTTLVLLEQVYRQSSSADRWRFKYLYLGLGFIYVFDFLMYTEGLILGQISGLLWESRGAVVACTAPLLAVSILRSQERSPQTPVARHVVFHTVTLLLAGVYLIFIACVAFAINVYGGTWGGVIQITFLSASGLFFMSVVLSARVRDKLRVTISKYFLSYRYDYRREWLEFTQALADSSKSTPSAITQAMAKLAGSPSAVLWVRDEDGGFSLFENAQVEHLDLGKEIAPVARWLEQSVWIVDLDEWRKHREIYGDLEIPLEIERYPEAWLLVPLMFSERLQGILLLTRPNVARHMNWEDRDLLKVAGRAAATHLARFQAHVALVESRQFEAFNRLSAYVVHDLKNILAQQSLIVSNAPRHRSNPEFIDDVFSTIENSVQRMTRLMAQMRSGLRGHSREPVELVPVLERVVAAKSQGRPVPRFVPPRKNYLVEADGEHLFTVFGHLVQNAQDATPPGGTVTVSLQPMDGSVKVMIRDTGAGMDADFIRDRLFKPFDTTKGLTGMGIGAVESRDYIRSLGGELHVQSSPGVGSCFTVVLPCEQHLNITIPETGDAVIGGQ